MNMPGFTADSAVCGSRGQYRMGLSSRRQADTIVPQSNPGPCFDWDCLSRCQEWNVYDAASCSAACTIPCDPYQPPELLPAG